MHDVSRLPRELPLDRVLELRAGLTPRAPSVIFARPPLSVELTFAELARLASRGATALRQRGVRRGDLVALVLEDHPDVLGAVYAIWRVGATIVPIDPRWGPQTSATVLEHARPALTLAHCEEGSPPYLTSPAATDVKSLFEGNVDDRASDSSPNDIAIVAFTSGTTTNPKGVMITHANLRAAYSIAREHLFTQPPLRFGSVFRMGGLGVLGLNFLFPLECGSATVVLPTLSLASAREFWEIAANYSIDFLYLVPTLVQLVTRLSRPATTSISLCVTGAAPISQALHEEFQNRFQLPLKNIYGMTEASFGIFYGALTEKGRGAWHLGPQIDPIMVRLRDISGKIVKGEGKGMLEVSGPTIASGYLNNASASAETFVDGWVRTGDIASRDVNGNYSIVGRVKDVVIRGGFNIHLDEVEQTLLTHSAVLSACAVGLSSSASGDETLGALVQVSDDFDGLAGDILNWCRDRIGLSKTPALCCITREDLPKNSHGKLLRREVRDFLERVWARRSS